jgi:hypothetical protein
MAVDNDGSHAMIEVRGMIRLATGLPPIRVAYFQGGCGYGLNVASSGSGVREQAVPGSAAARTIGQIGVFRLRACIAAEKAVRSVARRRTPR